jgi:phosphatidylinositol glycan class N
MEAKKFEIKFLLTGVLVHLIIFYSIFDVYFKSPIVSGVEPIERLTLKPSPAKRLVLFVADGLRADSFFNLIESDKSMFLSKKRFDSNAVFAISTSSVPTVRSWLSFADLEGLISLLV